MKWRYPAALILLCVLWWYFGYFRYLDTLPPKYGWAVNTFQVPCYFGAAFVLARWAYDGTYGKRKRWIRASRCGRCGYNLTGNTSGRCPECGQPLPNTTAPQPRRGGRL